jgi:hypothetical protein
MQSDSYEHGAQAPSPASRGQKRSRGRLRSTRCNVRERLLRRCAGMTLG